MKRSKTSVESNILPRLETRRLRLENRKAQQRRPHWYAEIDDYVHQLIRPIEKSAIFRFTGFCFAVFAVYQLTVDLSDRREERIERKEARLEHALDKLVKPSDSDNGRGEALNTLIEADYPVGGLDLSCQKVGIWDAKLGCIGRPTFQNIHYLHATAPLARLEKSLKISLVRDNSMTDIMRTFSSLEQQRSRNIPKFESANIENSEFPWLDLKLDQFEDTDFLNVDLRGTKIPNLIFSHFQDSNAAGAEIASSTLVYFRSTNISDATIHLDNYFQTVFDRNRENLGSADGHSPSAGSALNWAWADNPPLFPPENLSFEARFRELNRIDPYFLVLCDPTSRNIEKTTDQKVGIFHSTLSYFLAVLSGKVRSRDEPRVINNPLWFRDYKDGISVPYNLYTEVFRDLDIRSVRILQKNTPIIPEKGVCDIVPVEEAMKRWPGVYGMSIQ